MEPTTGKRIVSKGAYVKAVSTKAELRFSSVVLSLMGVFFGVTPLLVLLWLLVAQRNTGMLAFAGVLACVGIGLARGMFLEAIQQKAQADRIVIDVVPLTRANIGGLPFPESLVRASQEPPQAQKAVLLRAAAKGTETPPEEIVRASVRGDTL